MNPVQAETRLERLALGARALVALSPPARARFRAAGIVAESPEMLSVLVIVEKAARSGNTVLLQGETGTGKDVCARAIHELGPRAAGPFVVQNCAALPDALLESELFGHTRGAFTGADRTRQGLFEAASGGTLFLDEIGEASPAVQAKLLLALQDGEIRPLGGTRSTRIDVRIIAATNRNLAHEIERRAFRPDLYYRLGMFPITIPPLRDRTEDVVPLAQHFLSVAAVDHALPAARLTSDAIDALERHAWPGNVRELKNRLCHALELLDFGGWIAADPLGLGRTGAPHMHLGAEPALRDVLHQLEAMTIRRRLQKHGYRPGATARSLGISRETLWRKLRRLNVVFPPAPGQPLDGGQLVARRARRYRG